MGSRLHVVMGQQTVVAPWKSDQQHLVRSGRLLELKPPVFPRAPLQGQHVSAKEARVPVFKWTET